MMVRYIFLVSLMLLFMGCSSKGEIAMSKSLEQMSSLGKVMQKTEKISINDGNETKVFLTATYLNGQESLVDEKKRVREKFVIGLYLADDANPVNLINADQNLTINIPYPESEKEFSREEKKKRSKGLDKLPLLVKKLSLDDPMLKNIPMVNSWSSYFYVEFPHSEKEKFALTYQNKIYGKIPMKKKKDAKSKKKKLTKKKLTKKKVDEKKKAKISKKKEQKQLSVDIKKKKKEKIEKQRYRKYRMYFTKKYKYLGRGKVSLFGR